MIIMQQKPTGSKMEQSALGELPWWGIERISPSMFLDWIISWILTIMNLARNIIRKASFEEINKV